MKGWWQIDRTSLSDEQIGQGDAVVHFRYRRRGGLPPLGQAGADAFAGDLLWRHSPHGGVAGAVIVACMA
ncbi:hypothetical protein ACQP0U_20775 [Micromonospora sp. CA-269861]|uniref:hypothetical protein n=1 Tax=Micromonospora sp. CA-269861 TaxID=3239968 RepID=UPI003D8AC866